MSFYHGCKTLTRRFRLVLASFLQSDGLPFGNVLPEGEIERAFKEEGVSFPSPDDEEDAVYTPPVTLWAFLSQKLHKGEQRSCVAAVGSFKRPQPWSKPLRSVILSTALIGSCLVCWGFCGVLLSATPRRGLFKLCAKRSEAPLPMLAGFRFPSKERSARCARRKVSSRFAGAARSVAASFPISRFPLFSSLSSASL